MRESEKNIRAYKEMLPHMKERVLAAVSLLAIAVTMMASVTYAWFALSKSPEVKGLQTTLAANGNLEIALATGEVITIPADSQVGDGALDLVQKNITWGNLINLGDPTYGLEHIVLRPAALNKNNLLESPLYAASYGKDGRVEMLDSDFAYAYWDQDTFTADPAKFKYGVRAISSVTYGQAPGQNLALADAVKKAEQSTKQSQMSMQELARHSALQDLVGLMGAYVQAQIDEKLGGGSEPFINVSPDQIESIIYLMSELKESIELSATALADIYNMEMLRRSDQAFVAANKFTGEYLLAETQANIQNKLKLKNTANELVVQPSMLSYLWQLRTDYNTLVADLAVVETYRGRDDVKYRNLEGSTYPTIETYVNHIADVGTATINGTAIGKLSASNISSLTGGGTKPIVIHKGIIQRMDKFTGAQIESNELSVTVKVFGMGSTATGKATTSAIAPYVLPAEKENALSGDTSYKGSTPIAADTFGLALDFWVRTNAANTQLTLAGNPVYESVEQDVVVKMGDKTYSLYTVTATVDGQPVSATAYFEDSDDTYYAYDLETHTPGDALGKANQFSKIETLKETVTTIVGYNGVNRIWDEDGNSLIDGSSTTMGAGSCYVFYPKSPEDQAKSLQLLKHLKFAFVDQYGTLLGQAVMDTDNAYEQPGKVTVPIVCDVTNSSTTDVDGNPIYYITDLEANTPTLITALLYLDGMNLTNDQVLAAGDIQGHMNLQFSTTTDLKAMSDPVLMQEKCKVTAMMEGSTSVSIDAPIAERTKKVTVRVEGYEPKSVVAYFLREINNTQGIRQGKMTFEQDGNGNWIASYPFTASGKYLLREVQLDGVTYNLDQENPLEFTVEGFTISDIYCEHDDRTYMTAERKFDTKVSLTFSTNDVAKMPKSVKGAFIHTETKNRTTVNFTRDTGSTWVGETAFTTSGEYEMTYLELDGEYTGLPEDDYININLYLGLTASVYTGDTNFGLEEGESRDIPMTLVIRTDSGELIGNLGNVWLQYADNNSSVPEDGVGAGMVWNSSRKMYEGTFHLTKAGIFDYQYVSIKMGDDLNYLTYADTAPTITAIPTSIPTYLGKEGFGNAFSLGSDAAFIIRMKNAGSATVDAKLLDQNGKAYYVRGDSTTENGEQYFTFLIPVVDGKQTGTWTLDGLYLTNVYGGANNTLINAPVANGPDTATDDKPLYTVADGYYSRWWAWDVEEVTDDGEGVPTIKVGSQINISFTNSAANANKDFGKDGNGNVTGAFGANYALNNLELQVLAEGKPLSEYGMTLSKVQLVYKYDQNSSFSKVNNTVSKNNYGNYTIQSTDIGNLIAGDRGTIEYTLGSGSNGVYALTTANPGLSVAGSYKADANNMKLVITTAKGETVEIAVPQSVVAGAPVYSVYSAKMDAKIDSFAPNKTGYLCSNNAKDALNTVSSSINAEKTNVTLYCEMQKNGNGFTILTDPYVTLKLTNKAVAGEVKVQFSGDTTRMYEAARGTVNTAYTWSASTGDTCTRYIGRYQQSRTCSNAVVEPAGTLTASEITITLNGITFTMAIDTITITNPAA